MTWPDATSGEAATRHSCPMPCKEKRTHDPIPTHKTIPTHAPPPPLAASSGAFSPWRGAPGGHRVLAAASGCLPVELIVVVIAVCVVGCLCYDHVFCVSLCVVVYVDVLLFYHWAGRSCRRLRLHASKLVLCDVLAKMLFLTSSNACHNVQEQSILIWGKTCEATEHWAA